MSGHHFFPVKRDGEKLKRFTKESVQLYSHKREAIGMNILSALMEKDCIRVSCGDKWLIYINGDWIVYQRKYGAKKTRTICVTDEQDTAVEALCS